MINLLTLCTLVHQCIYGKIFFFDFEKVVGWRGKRGFQQLPFLSGEGWQQNHILFRFFIFLFCAIFTILPMFLKILET